MLTRLALVCSMSTQELQVLRKRGGELEHIRLCRSARPAPDRAATDNIRTLASALYLERGGIYQSAILQSVANTILP